MKISLCVLACAALFLTGAGLAETRDQDAPRPSAEDQPTLDAHGALAKARWLEGCWAGEGLGGEVQECWMWSPDGRFTGAFQFVLEGRLVFSEMLALAPFEDGLAYRVKHFSPGFDQWESDEGKYVSFPLLELGENYLQFEGLRYELVGEILEIDLDMHQSDGSIETMEFSMRRK